MSTQRARPPASEHPKRKYTSRACEQCRRRRAKCDGARPACARCLSRGQACQYAGGEDGRKPASKTYVDLLRRRIQALEQVLRNHDIDIDASLAALSSSHPDLADSGSLSANLDPSLGETTPDIEALCAAFDGTLSIEEALNYEGDGEFRYFGPTSGRLQFISDSAPEQSQAAPLQPQMTATDSITAKPSAEVNRRNLPEYDTEILLSEELRSELVDLYFTWQNPWLLVVDEKLYRQSHEARGRYWSPLLENCILAIGSRFTDNPEIRADPDDTNSAGRLFFERAEVHLSYELKFPSITTVQSLFLLSTLSVATGADATSWLRQGMAKQLAFDLGINLDAERVSGSNSISAEEVELRRLLYWSMYCDDKLAAAYTGRVCTLLDFQGLIAWPSVPSLEVTSFGPSANTRSPRTLMLLLHALIRLSHILEDIMVSLYMPKPKCQGTLRAAFFDSCCLKLKTWMYDLPPELRLDRLDATSLPQAFTLHMVYSTAGILLARPYLVPVPAAPNSSIAPPKTLDGKVLAEIQKADVLLQTSAKQICSTARKYRRVFGSFRRSPITATHCTLSAALVFLRNAKPHSVVGIADVSSSAFNTEDIKLCLDVLDELSTSWDTARRIRLNLLKLFMKSRSTGFVPGEDSYHSVDDGTGHGRGQLDKSSSRVQASSSSPEHPDWREPPTFHYEPLVEHPHGPDGQTGKSPMDALAASLGFGLEHTLETMIGDQMTFGTDLMNDDFEWDAFLQP